MSICSDDFNFGNINESRSFFIKNRFVIFRDLLSKDKIEFLKSITFEDKKSPILRRDFLMPSSNNTPRHLSVISGDFLNNIKCLSDLYCSPKILASIKKIISDDKGELDLYWDNIANITAIRLDKKDDVQGEHIDDHAYVFIICMEDGDGAEVRIEKSPSNQNPKNNYDFIDLKVGDGYLMRSDEVAHEVLPLRGDSPRSVLKFNYDIKKRIVNTNGSVPMLFGRR